MGGFTDEIIEPYGLLVSDELRKMLAEDSSSSSTLATLFPNDQQNEFILEIFKGLCLGGEVCQYEDYITEYLQVTKLLYKDLLSVRKGPDGKLKVCNRVFKVEGFAKVQKSPLFAQEAVQNFCFVSVRGIGGVGLKCIDIWYHGY